MAIINMVWVPSKWWWGEIQPEWVVSTLDYFSLLAWWQIQTNYLKTDSQTYAHRYQIWGNTIWIWYRWAWLFICWWWWSVYWSSYDDLYAHIYIIWKPYNWERVNWVQTPYQTTRRYASSIQIYSMTCNWLYEKTDKSELVMKVTMSTSWWDYVRYFIIKPSEYSVTDSYTTTWYTTLTDEPITEVSMWLKDYSVVVQMAPTLYFPWYPQE